MDFNYSAEDESFRCELRAWLEANVTEEMHRPQLGFMADAKPEAANRERSPVRGTRIRG